MDSLGSLNWDTCSVIENSLTLFALAAASISVIRSEEHTSELQSRSDLVCRLLLEKKKKEIHPERRQGTTSPPRTKHGALELIAVNVRNTALVHLQATCHPRTARVTRKRPHSAPERQYA